MPLRLRSDDPGFESAFAALLGDQLESSTEVDAVVAGIIADVRARGDTAICELTEKFEGIALKPQSIRLSAQEIADAAETTPPKVRAALETARDRIAAHHEKQRPADHIYEDELGVTLGTVWHPVASVGIYVPGGLASYPSSVLMNAVPAKVAGVERVAMTVPTPGGHLDPAVMAAASMAGVTEIYRIGGAQAIAALAYGTNTITPVVKIVGPGNAYVAAAKRQVFGAVGIDMIAGPSEVLIIADASANPAWVAADLLAQIEHGAGARGVLVSIDAALADAVAGEVERQIEVHPRADISRQGWQMHGATIVVSSLDEAIGICNRYAPEHVEIALDEPEAVLGRIHNAGAIFLGHFTPEAIGDYVGGTNHVLPTARSARFASGLGVTDFMKRTSVLGCDPASLAELAAPAETLAEAEGLDAHRRSIAIRLNR
jgi:histidinol dehydrogenase